ncbi:MAG TPA: ABC transporter permease [Gemmatimonadales bacterium]|nr:ABC transporter permease [Gemmatimonadales bacterium]
MWAILFEEFWGDLKAQKTRAFLTMFAITWGTIAIVLLLAFGEGLGDAFMRGTVNAGNHILMIYGGETGMTYEGLPKGRRIRLDESDLALLKETIPGIDFASASYAKWGSTFAYGSVKSTTYMEGVQPQFEMLRSMYPDSGGRFIDQQDVALKRRVLFLGDSMAFRLFKGANPIGKTVTVDRVPFTVIGVMEDKLQFDNNNGPDADRAIIPASTFASMYGQHYVDHLIVRPRDVALAPRVKREVYETLGRRHKFDARDVRALGIWDFVEETKMISGISTGIQVFLTVVGGFTLLIAGVGVANIMYVVVRERTREIGVKLAVGARRKHIMSQFVFEALLLCLTGGAIGLAISGTVVGLVRMVPQSTMTLQILANPILSWPVAFTAVGILTVIGLAAGYLPARRAAAVDPVESLRYE